MTSSEVIAFLGQLEYDGDDRKPPDSSRLGRFKVGWGDATDRSIIYGEIPSVGSNGKTWATDVASSGGRVQMTR
jgi:hypothetical protein